MDEDRLKHSIAVARKMVEIAKVKFEWWRY
mgnify:FL=1